jgi:hypothetical protein
MRPSYRDWLSSSGQTMNAYASPPPQRPLARLPLQIGTNAAWGAGRAAATLFPGLACMGGTVALGVVAGGGNDALAIPLARVLTARHA